MISRSLSAPTGRGDVHRVDHVGEQNRDLLVLRVGITVVDR